MKKISFLLTMFMVAMLCMTTSCKKDKGGDDPEPESPYLTLEQFAKKSWSGSDQAGHGVSLKIQSTSKAQLQYTPKSVAKNTDPTPVTVDITYTYDQATGKFKGTGSDNNEYTASLKSKTELEFYVKPLGETVVLK